MDEAPRGWTTGTLADALSDATLADELSVERIEQAEPVLKLTMHDFGDLAVFASVGGDQIVVSTLLWPVDEQEDQTAFNRFLLKTQKLVPLSNFAIAEVDGREYYELIGELSVESRLSTILIELRVLAQNAIDAASDLRTEFAA
ncbi:YjfI family protein [Sphingomonas sp. CFBP 13720]|uniref:YjfI family protein n=1 Tax=Sphingomonas sp. CFBP 13720 TaxID=2775302 RepID=UPI00178288D0|nr:YjfI family protein [Sphingomonas sp. CFBP 13720]MBD8677787.1 YjfI family protein [Sphingomonas sp. CFBP 13720]